MGINWIVLKFLLSPNAKASGWTFISQVSSVVHIPEHVLGFCLVACLLTLGGFYYRSALKKCSNPIIPDRGFSFRNIVEMYGEFIMAQCENIIGPKEGPKYFNYVGFVFLMILCCNLIGLIPGFLPPTENINTTLALGSFTFIYYNLKGCKAQGVGKYLAHFCGPLWYLAFLVFPIEILSNFVRPISLALRLRGNMFGDHLVLGVFSGLVPLVVPCIFMLLGVLVSLIQAYVFTMLTLVYISLAVSHHDHDESHAHH